MAEAFNPYHEWLGIRDLKRPLSYYRLLGIDPDETDPHFISNAGDGVIARVRSYRPGNHVVEWQNLIDELMSAKLCLLDPERKQRYDIERAASADEKSSNTVAPQSVVAAPTSAAAAQPRNEAPSEPPSPGATSPGLGFMWPPGLEPLRPKQASNADPNAASSNPISGAPNVVLMPEISPTASGGATVDPGSASAAPTAAIKYPADFAAASAPVASVVAPNVAAPPSMPPTHFVPGAGVAFNPMAPNPMAPVMNSPMGNAPTMGYPAAPNPMAPNPMAPHPMAPNPMMPMGPNPMAPIVASVGATNWPPGFTGAGGNVPLPPQPVIAQPVMAQPVMAQPVISQPVIPQPVMVQPVAQPVISQPIIAQPVVSQPIAQAVTSQAVVAQPVQVQPVQATPVQAQPVAPQAVSIAPLELNSGIETTRSAVSSTTYRKSINQRSSAVPAFGVGLALVLLVVALGLSLTNSDNNPHNKDATAQAPAKPKHPATAKPKTNPAAKSQAKLQTYTTSPSRPRTDSPENVDLVSLDPSQPSQSEPAEMPAEDTPATDPTDKPGPVEPTPKDPSPAPEPEVPTTPDPAPSDPTPDPAPSDPTPPETEAQPSKEQEAKWRKAMADTLRALRANDLSEAQSQLTAASKAAVSTKQKDRVEGLRTVYEGVENYWKAVGESLKGLQTGDEIMIGNTRAAVVESSEDALIIHAGGKNRRYDVKHLSLGIANFLAERWFDANAPSTKISLGAIQFVDPNGDRAEAKRLWEEAGNRGQQIEHLLPLLDEKFGAGGQNSESEE